MNRLRANRPSAWIALLAMVLGALAPTVSHALALSRAAVPAALEVCTTDGLRRVVSEPAGTARVAVSSSNTIPVGSPGGQEPTSSLNHCPLCLPAADRLGPPPMASVPFFNAESGLVLPDAQAPYFRSVPGTLALPRGPPSHS